MKGSYISILHVNNTIEDYKYFENTANNEEVRSNALEIIHMRDVTLLSNDVTEVRKNNYAIEIVE